MQPVSPVELGRTILAISVLHDLDVEHGHFGVMLPGRRTVWVSWAEARRALGQDDPACPAGRDRLARWLLARRWAADLSGSVLTGRLRAVGLPPDHVLHPGRGWCRRAVPGGGLQLGIGAVGLVPAQPDRVVPLPPPALEQAGVDGDRVWRRLGAELEGLGGLAGQALGRRPGSVLRPMGDADVVTLLGSERLRTAVAGRAGGMAAAVVPSRRRGWTDPGLIDPAFGPVAAAATDPEDLGFPRPVLVTADGLYLAPAGGRPQVIALREAAPQRSWDRQVLYR